MLHKPVVYKSNDGATTFTINDQTSINANWIGGDPFYISVDSVDGLNSADISFESHPLPNMTGERSGDVFRRGKTITLSGTIWGSHLSGLTLGSEYLAQMFWETKPRKLIFYPQFTTTQVYFTCRVNNDLSVAQSKPTDWNYRWTWVVGLRADDPRMYNVTGDTIYKSWMT